MPCRARRCKSEKSSATEPTRQHPSSSSTNNVGSCVCVVCGLWPLARGPCPCPAPVRRGVRVGGVRCCGVSCVGGGGARCGWGGGAPPVARESRVAYGERKKGEIQTA